MVIDNFDAVGVVGLPAKADTPLIVDPDAVLAFSVSAKLLQSITWWNSQVIERFGSIDKQEFPQCGSPQWWREPLHRLPMKQPLRLVVGKTLDHAGQ